MNKKLYIPILAILFVVLLSGCKPVELTPIIIRITATPAPRTPTPIPAATDAPTQPPAASTESSGSTSSESQPTEVPTEAPTESAVQSTEITFKFVSPFQTIEEVEPFILKVEAFDGVLLASGNENSITISYDTNVTDVDTLMSLLQQAGKAVEEPEG